MAKASKILAAARVEDLVQIRLDGAFLFPQVREYALAQGQNEKSPWHLAEGEEPLSDGQLRRYVQRADTIIAASFERNRKRLLRRHVAQRRSLFARAVTTGEIGTALAILKDEAALLNLYPPARHQHSGPGGGPIPAKVVIDDPASKLQPYAGAVREFLASLERRSSDESLPADGPGQSLDTRHPQADGQASALPAAR